MTGQHQGLHGGSDTPLPERMQRPWGVQVWSVPMQEG